MAQDTDIIDQLNALRDRHRLAIHIWESVKPFHFPRETLNTFSEIEAAAIPEAIGNKTMPILSMSLFPAGNTNQFVRPWNVNKNFIYGLSYLINLDQDRKDAPRVIRAKPYNLDSGTDVYQKNLRLGQNTGIPKMNYLYQRSFRKNEETWLHAMAGDEGSKYTSRQLDVLGEYYTPKEQPVIKGNNEILVAAHRSHIAAICIPSFMEPPLREWEVPLNEWYAPLNLLAGAVSGIEHSRQGFDLPVIRYHINAPRKEGDPAQGAFEYIGKGSKELIPVALDAIRELNRADMSKETDLKRFIRNCTFEDIRKNVKEVLGIDIAKPLSEQHAAVEALRQQMPAGVERG